MTFKDREILPIGGTRFGIVLTQKEAEALAGHGFNVKSKTLAPGEDPSHYLVVWVSAAKLNDGFNLSRLETDGRADVVIHPEPWKAGGRTGVKAYVVATWAKSESPAGKLVNDRYEIAWRIWCWQQGYGKAEDRVGLRNWMREDDSQLHPNDIKDKAALLPVADMAIELAKEES